MDIEADEPDNLEPALDFKDGDKLYYFNSEACWEEPTGHRINVTTSDKSKTMNTPNSTLMYSMQKNLTNYPKDDHGITSLNWYQSSNRWTARFIP